MLEAAQRYVLKDAPGHAVLSNGPPLLDSVGNLSSLMERERDLPEEDKAVKKAMRSVVDAVVVRRGGRIQQHMRGMLSHGTEGQVELEKEWFSGHTPTALEEYDEWITNHHTQSPDPMEEPRSLFMDTWRETWKNQKGQDSTGVPGNPDRREEPTSAVSASTIMNSSVNGPENC